jgi:1-acyl-sn-glycerol-3-phosphate acyltransferase
MTDARRPGRPASARVAAYRLSIRYWVVRSVLWVVVRAIVRLRVEGLERLPPGPAMLCFNHLSWADPIIVMASLPGRPRLHFFGPRETDMTVGGRNRLMTWVGTAVPFRPEKDDLVAAARRVAELFAAGRRLAIFAEGRIHAVEGELLPLEEGAVHLALRSGVPIVPVAIIGTSWLGVGRTVRVVVGEPIRATGRPNRVLVDAVTAEVWCSLFELSRDAPRRPPPGRVGRWLTERFNDWPEGGRPERTAGAVGPVPTGIPVVGPHGPCPPGGA